MTMELEACNNCGRPIGKLEAAHLWDEKIVCAECIRRLGESRSESKRKGFGSFTFLIPLIILLASGCAILSIYGYMSAGKIEQARIKASDDLAIEKLRVENQQLAATVVRLETPTPILTQINSEISGSVWISHNNGTSDVQRGVQVVLLRPLMQGSALCAALSKDKVLWEHSELFWGEEAKKNAVSASSNYRKIVANYENVIATKAASQTKRIAEMIQRSPASIAVDGAYRLEKDARYQPPNLTSDIISAEAGNHDLVAQELDAVQHLSNALDRLETKYGNFRFAVAPVAFQTATTTVDGKYNFSDVPPGSYFIYAQIETETFSVDWLIPVTVPTSGKIKQDLYNDNASSIHD